MFLAILRFQLSIIVLGTSLEPVEVHCNTPFTYIFCTNTPSEYCTVPIKCTFPLNQFHSAVQEIVFAQILVSIHFVGMLVVQVIYIFHRPPRIRFCDAEDDVLSAQGLHRQLNTFCVFHQMNHHILGLSSRSVSLTRYTLTFRTCKLFTNASVPFKTAHVIQVQEVDEVNV